MEKEVAEDHASVLGRLVQRGHTLRILDSVGQKMGDEREREMDREQGKKEKIYVSLAPFLSRSWPMISLLVR